MKVLSYCIAKMIIWNTIQDHFVPITPENNLWQSPISRCYKTIDLKYIFTACWTVDLWNLLSLSFSVLFKSSLTWIFSFSCHVAYWLRFGSFVSLTVLNLGVWGDELYISIIYHCFPALSQTTHFLQLWTSFVLELWSCNNMLGIS